MHQLPTRADQMIKRSTGADQLNDKKDYKSNILGWQGKGFKRFLWFLLSLIQ